MNHGGVLASTRTEFEILRRRLFEIGALRGNEIYDEKTRAAFNSILRWSNNNTSRVHFGKCLNDSGINYSTFSVIIFSLVAKASQFRAIILEKLIKLCTVRNKFSDTRIFRTVSNSGNIYNETTYTLLLSISPFTPERQKIPPSLSIEFKRRKHFVPLSTSGTRPRVLNKRPPTMFNSSRGERGQRAYGWPFQVSRNYDSRGKVSKRRKRGRRGCGVAGAGRIREAGAEKFAFHPFHETHEPFTRPANQFESGSPSVLTLRPLAEAPSPAAKQRSLFLIGSFYRADIKNFPSACSS